MSQAITIAIAMIVRMNLTHLRTQGQSHIITALQNMGAEKSLFRRKSSKRVILSTGIAVCVLIGFALFPFSYSFSEEAETKYQLTMLKYRFHLKQNGMTIRAAREARV